MVDGQDDALRWLLAIVNAGAALALALIASVGWAAISPAATSPAARLFLRTAAAVLSLGVLHHACDAAAAVLGPRPHLQAVTGAALAVMGLFGAYVSVHHGHLLRHLVTAPAGLDFAVRRAHTAEAALAEIRREMVGTVRSEMDTAADRVSRIEGRLVRDADAAEIISRMISRLCIASLVTTADGVLTVSTANPAFWGLARAGSAPGSSLATALGLDARDSARVLVLLGGDGATVVVTARGPGGTNEVELTTEYAPAEPGGRTWITCRSLTPRSSKPRFFGRSAS